MTATFPTLMVCVAAVGISGLAGADQTNTDFDHRRDLISLHYDHAPDKDDGHSAVADRTLLETQFGKHWLADHVVPVSGAYGKNADRFNPKSDRVMEATWADVGGWLAAHDDHDRALENLVARWSKTLRAGGDVWVKEGGQSDITAAAVQQIGEDLPEVDTTQRIHVVQHSDWNEDQTTDSALAYVKQHTDYIRIRDANAYLNVAGGDEEFVRASLGHPTFGPMWQAAYDYYDPKVRLDFSDTGELLHLLGLGELGIDAFRERFLEPNDAGGQ